MARDDKPGANSEGWKISSAPSISLPRGGGAIRGIGEKFAANPVTGTGSMSIPVASSPGRSGFGPHLSLSYDSGAGNGPFGFGWALGLPLITRKTDKGLPQYRDAEQSDVFVLSGAEDLVRVLVEENGKWVPETLPDRAIGTDTYTVDRYRPRIEGLFARIERWTRNADGDVHWRSISKDNILTLYGKDSNSRIADPVDPLRVFTWLICETRDDKGNAVLYEYKLEDGVGVDLARAHERNRGDRNDPRRATNRYLKRIRYGNRLPLLDDAGQRPRALTVAQIQNAGWMFEVVLDYGEHDADAPKPDDAGSWNYRTNPFSSYRAGFEVRTGRLCQRVLMFHHFAGEPGVGVDCLVRSTDFTYSHEQDPANARNPVYTFLLSVTQTGYKRNNGGYQKSSLPPVEYEYTQPIVQGTVQEVDAASLENLPIGVDGVAFQWTDLHGEGIPGILAEQAGAWFYKRNISPISERTVEFAPLERVATKPNLSLAGGQAQFMDLAGDGQPDLVVLDGPMPGLYEHDEEEGWQPFRPFTSRLNRDLRDPNLKFVDLDGDGHGDVLISEDDAFVWHASLAEQGFGPARRVHQALDEEKSARVVFADGTQSIYLADVNGDGLTNLIRIRNGDICYWPNLGYGRFGAKVTMDHAPHFDHPDQFDQKRIRLADIDGTGTTDLIYLHRDGVCLYFNQSGNSWSASQRLRVFPCADDLVNIIPTDLLGNGTVCLVWSSPLPGDARRPMRYVDLMGGQKPHLLIKTINNLGAETRVAYAASTKFYLRDKYDGQPWITRLPFSVHVVERVETYDHVSRNRFVTRYAYHHGYFDGKEREFRGFGMVEQWDTEQLTALSNSDAFPVGDNVAAESHVPPVHTKTWFHTGVYLGRDHISDFFAGLFDAQDKGESYREPGLTDAEARALLLADTILPPGLTLAEEREACRSLKGVMLRQEVYALDGTPKAAHPYIVTEQNFTIQRLQPREGNRHAVFFTHAREAINFHYERNPADPRVQHALTLEVDPYGNVLKEAAIGYGRRMESPDGALWPQDRDKQRLIHITCTENAFTNAILNKADVYRGRLPAESRTYELRRPQQEKSGNELTTFHRFDAMLDNVRQAGDGYHDVDYEDIQFTKAIQAVANDVNEGGKYFRRLIEHVRTLYRPNDLGISENDPSRLLPLKTIESMAVPGESYKLAFTPGLLNQVYIHSGLLLLPPNPADVLVGGGGYVDLDGDDHWWIPAGRVFYSDNPNHTAGEELAEAQAHFFLPRSYRDPFHTNAVSTESFVTYAYDLLIVETRDALGNRITVGERDEVGNLTLPGNDYRVLQPWRVMDPNRNRTEVVFDALGLVVGTAVMGKSLPATAEGDTLEGFEADLTQDQIDGFYDAADPHVPAVALLESATTRIVYDLGRFQRTRQAHPNDPSQWLPVYAATLSRETHANDPLPPQGLKIQISFSYSDGSGREIQRKIQAEPGPVIEGGPDIDPRWVGSGWTIFNNKGKPVRQYEPFFSRRVRDDGTIFSDYRFEFARMTGVSPILFYDPVERVVATLHANHTYEKVVFDPWQQTTWDVNDTVLADPRTDDDIKGFTASYFAGLPADAAAPWQTWHVQRQGGALGAQEQSAASKAAAHTNTPTTAHVDTLGRPFLTLAHNGFNPDTTPIHFATRIELDIEGNQRAVRDAIEQAGDPHGRIVTRYDYDMLGNRIHQLSMEAGARWMLNDVAGKPIRAWDSRAHTFRTEYDELRRPVRAYVIGADPDTPNREILFERTEYGEDQANDTALNLRTRVFRHYDGAGLVTSMGRSPLTDQDEAYDFKGNLLRCTRQLLQQYRVIADWSQNPAPEDEIFTTSTTYDALNRPVTLTTPHSPTMQPSIIRPGYNEANLLERVDANLRGAAANGQPVWTPFVSNIDYDAKGQRQRIDYATQDGRLISTSYTYDRDTFRLTHLYTRRGVDPLTRHGVTFADDCNNPQPPPPTIAAPDVPPPNTPCGLQNLQYIYDPVGNITHIRDEAQQTIYFRNQRVEPSADYTYDALYRLIEATGREHLGQVGGSPIPHSYNDAPRVGIDWSANDGNAMGTYVEQYVYDAVGNFQSMQHRGSDQGHPGWTRDYAYFEPSLIEPAKQSNRLSNTTVVTNNPVIEPYTYDAHGNMLGMPQLQVMQWDFKDQLQVTQRQAVNAADEDGVQRQGERTWYVYDAGGHRVRKVTDRAAQNGSAPRKKEERLYLGGFEIYRACNGNGADVSLKRETLHIMDDKQRIAVVETRTLDTAGTDPAPAQLIRYQFGNHLGSASLELDEQAQIISYEEYTPYGSTSYQAVRSQTETPKRYRYTGMERDDESGLNYHTARYYSPWLGRWTSCDPAGLVDGPNLFRFGRSNPICFADVSGTIPIAEPYIGETEQAEIIALEPFYVTGSVPADAPPAHWSESEKRNLFRTDLSGARAVAQVGGVIGGVGVAAFAVAAFGVPAATKAFYWAIANPIKATAVVQFAAGLIDPNPAGTLDLPGPVDDAGRATRRVTSIADEAAGMSDDAVRTVDDVVREGNVALNSARPLARTIDPSGGLTREIKNELREEAREIARSALGRLPSGSDVHHRIPLEFAHLFPELNPNRIQNLIVITDREAREALQLSFHGRLHELWTAHLNDLRRSGLTPSRADIESIAAQIDEQIRAEFGRRAQFLGQAP